MRYFFLSATIFFSFCLSLQAQRATSWLKTDSTGRLQPYAMVQLWTVYSHGMRADTNGDGTAEAAENRLNIHLRRARLGFRGQPYPFLKFTVAGYFDLLGRDALGASIGGANNPPEPVLGIWDAFFTWQPVAGKNWLHVTGGYFRPQYGRESITSGFATTSGEKAMQQNYIRRHLVGAGPGRATGINLGGLLGNSTGKLHFNYNLGLFNPLFSSSLPNTVGIQWSPLLAGRLVLMLGDPEFSDYKIGYQTNYYNQRKGLSLGVSLASQGQTDLFTTSQAASVDFLLNYGRFNADGEWHFMRRKGTGQTDGRDPLPFTAPTRAGHLRVSYNLQAGTKLLEPVLMVMQFNGATTTAEQQLAAIVQAFSGRQRTVQAGFNYYLNRHHLKLLLFYASETGQSGRNLFTGQSAVGVPIERGNYLQAGLNAVF